MYNVEVEIKLKNKNDQEKLSKLELDIKDIQLQKAEKNKLNRTQKIKFEMICEILRY